MFLAISNEHQPKRMRHSAAIQEETGKAFSTFSFKPEHLTIDGAKMRAAAFMLRRRERI